MKIAIVAPEHPNSQNYGGIARYLRDYLPRLAQECQVLLISVEDAEAIEGVEQCVLPSNGVVSPLAPFFYSGQIVEKVKEFRADLVEYSNWMGLGCRDNGPWARVVRLSTPVLHNVPRPGLLPKMARPLHHYLERATASHAHLWMSSSHENLKTCREVYRISKTDEIIPLGIDLPLHTIPTGKKDIIFVGRFDARKGVDILLHAWKKVIASSEYEGGTLHLVGRDTLGIGGSSYLRESLHKNGFTPKNLVIHGSLNDKDLQVLRRECGIAVVPSCYESFGMVVLEAFSAGHAVVASRTGGLQEVIKHQENGILFTKEDGDELAAHLLTLLQNSDHRSTLARGGQRALMERFSMEQMVSRSLTAYDRAISLRER